MKYPAFHLHGYIHLPVFIVLAFACIAHAHESHDEFQVRFVENKGQWEKQILYRLDFTNGAVFFEDNAFTYSFLKESDLARFYELKFTRHGDSLLQHHVIHGHAYRMKFNGANPAARKSGMEAYPDWRNYFLGNDPSRWASHVLSYRKIIYHGLYPGVDLLVYGSESGNLKYDFLLQAGANPGLIRLEYEGIDDIHIQNGNLVILTSVNEVIEQKPVAWQVIEGERKYVPCRYVLDTSRKTVHFDFPDGYDPGYPLVIDPQLIFSTYTGSTADNWGYTATYDQYGNFYAGGIAFGTGYPVTPGAYQLTFSGGASNGYPTDVSITKYNPQGTNLIYSTYLGGSENEIPQSIIVTGNDELVVYGSTSSSDFPVTFNAYDNSFNGGVNVTVTNVVLFTFGSDIFVTKFDASGSSLIGSTYIGGSDNDGLNTAGQLEYNYGDHARGEVIVDSSGNVYVASVTRSANFPVTPGALQSTRNGNVDGCVFKFSSDLSTLLWSTYLGGSATDACYSLKLDSNYDLYVCGGTRSSDFPATAGALHPSFQGGTVDGYVVHLSKNGDRILEGTYLGTSQYDQAYFVDIDFRGDVYVLGQSLGNYPVTPGAYVNPGSSQFIQKLNSTLSTSLMSTVIGNGLNEINISPTAFLVDKCGNIYLSGWGGQVNTGFGNGSNGLGATLGNTNNLPVTPDAFQPTTDGSDFYFMVLAPDADSLLYATYFGGVGPNGEHVDGGTSRFDENGIIYQAVCAACGGTNIFPTTPGAWSQTNNSPNCNLGSIKFEFSLSGVDVEVTPSSFQGCKPLTIQFNSNAVNAKNYFWDFGDNTFSTDSAPVHTYTDTGIYHVMLVGWDSASLCTFASHDTAYAIIRVFDDSVKADFIPQQPLLCDSFLVTITDLSANSNNYWWDFGDGNTSTAPEPAHTYQQPGTYDITLIVTNPNTCNFSDTLTRQVTFPEHAIAHMTVSDTAGCAPLTVSFASQSLFTDSIFWQFGDGNSSTLPAPVHTYQNVGHYTAWLIAVDTGVCAGTDSIRVRIRVHNDSVTAAFNHVPSRNCDSLLVDFLNLSTNASAYIWDFGDNTTSTFADPSHQYPDTGNYLVTLIAMNPDACKTADTITTPVTILPPVVAAFLPPAAGCAPLTVNFANNSINAATYIWDFGDGITDTASAPSHVYTAPGQYTVSLIAINPVTCNLTDTLQTQVVVEGPPATDFLMDTTIVLLNQPVAFTNLTSGGDAYLWTFGDGDSSALFEPVHSYTEPGNYRICLTATSPAGCPDSLCRNVTVIFNGVVDIPNAFSPNGDGINDVLLVKGFGIEKIKLTIYNRWGEVVYETNDVNEAMNIGWDGTYKGEPQEMEVYVYKLEATFLNDEQRILKGNITLLR